MAVQGNSRLTQVEEGSERIIISPSIYAADFYNLEHEISRIPSADWIHVDIMDGLFVPNFSMGYPQIRALKQHTDKLLDVHLMIEKPIRYIKDFSDAGADVITVHVESDSEENIRNALTAIHNEGKTGGLAVSPDTPAEAVLPYLSLADLILVMTIYPGIPNQRLLPRMLEKIRKVRSYLDIKAPACLLEADGGISPYTIGEVVKAGASVIVSGGAIFGNADADSAVREMRKIGERT
ncbi:MAG: ribulose-phosphate 3-epimerase [Lachnospiraceae bacterium]|nr:ribulose-phosphate 3-epimerase [Lachnospiraceae bacterium]